MKTTTKEEKQLQSQLNRAKTQLEQLEKSHVFTEKDIEILKPRYQMEIELLTKKLKKHAH